MSWLETVGAALGLGIAGFLGWAFRSWIEDLRAAERALNDDRRRIYAEVLSPYIDIVAATGTGVAPATATPDKMRRLGFDLMLVASDDVARAYGDLMQHSFMTKNAQPLEMLRLFARFQLAIRRSLGNRATRLTEVDMVRFLLTDIKPFQEYLAKRA